MAVDPERRILPDIQGDRVQRGETLDFSNAKRAYEEALSDAAGHYAEVAVLTPDGKVVISKLGKSEEYGPHRVGSVTKMFTALLALKLENDGVLPHGLQTRCGEVIDRGILEAAFEDLEAASQMTLEQLLSHTAGLEKDDHCRQEDTGVYFTTLKERFQYEGEEGHKYRHTSQPGQEIGSYSNAGLAVAGWMMEAAYQNHYGVEKPFSEIMQTELFEGAFDLSESFIAPGPSGDNIQSPAGDMTSSAADLIHVAARFQRGEAALERHFGAGWQARMLEPRDLLGHHGLGCIANTSSIEHAGMNQELVKGRKVDVTALVVLPLRQGDPGLVAMCDSTALGPKTPEQRFIHALKDVAGITHTYQQPVYALDFFCPTGKGACLFHGDAFLVTDVNPFEGEPQEINCSRNGMHHHLVRDTASEKEGVRYYRDENNLPWLLISKGEQHLIYSDYCLVTQSLQRGARVMQQPDAAYVESLTGVYRNVEESDAHPTYTFTEKEGHLYLLESGDECSYPCLFVPDEKGRHKGTWVASSPEGRSIQFRFPDDPDSNFLEITDILSSVPQLPDQCKRI